jgi:hypothetical protein
VNTSSPSNINVHEIIGNRFVVQFASPGIHVNGPADIPRYGLQILHSSRS